MEAKELNLTYEDLAVKGKVLVDGEISNAGDVLLLRAKVCAQVERECSRCLKTFVAESKADVLEKFFPANAANIAKDAFSYEFDVVDITEALREGLLVVEPLKALCKEDCLGLCPVCGNDRNIQPCTCDETKVDLRLMALKQFIKN